MFTTHFSTVNLLRALVWLVLGHEWVMWGCYFTNMIDNKLFLINLFSLRTKKPNPLLMKSFIWLSQIVKPPDRITTIKHSWIWSIIHIDNQNASSPKNSWNRFFDLVAPLRHALCACANICLSWGQRFRELHKCSSVTSHIEKADMKIGGSTGSECRIAASVLHGLLENN